MIEEEENVKKIWKYAILLVALSALLCMSAFAADGPVVDNFNQDNVIAKVNDNQESFSVAYTGATAGKQYLVLMLAGADEKTMPDPTATNILYVNQTAADSEGKVVFDNVYPTTVEDSARPPMSPAMAQITPVTMLNTPTMKSITVAGICVVNSGKQTRPRHAATEARISIGSRLPFSSLSVMMGKMNMAQARPKGSKLELKMPSLMVKPNSSVK